MRKKKRRAMKRKLENIQIALRTLFSPFTNISGIRKLETVRAENYFMIDLFIIQRIIK